MSVKQRLNIVRTTAKTAQERADEMGGDSANRYDMKAGLHILMQMPSTDPRIHDPIRYAQVHHEPFHICLTGDAIDIGTEFKTSLDFESCPRCAQAWAAWREEGFKGSTWQEYEKHPLGERRREIGDQKAKISGLSQVVNVAPFFSVEPDGTVVVNPARMAMMPDFVTILAGGTPSTPIEKLPKDLVAAAKQGVTFLTGAQTNMRRLGKAHKKKVTDFRRDNKLPTADPLEYPDNVLLQIDAVKIGEYRGSDKLEWAPSYIDFSEEGWAVSDELMAEVMKQTKNLHNPVMPAGSTPEDYNNAYAPMPYEMLEQYLADNKWVMPGTEPKQQASDKPFIPDDSSDYDDQGDPDAHPDVQMAPDAAPANAGLRKRMTAREAAPMPDTSSFSE